MEAQPSIVRSVQIPYELYNELKEYAKREDKSVNSAIVEAIRKMIKGASETKKHQ